MRMRSSAVLALVAMAAAGVLFSGLFVGCSPQAKDKPFLETVFDEGRALFYKTAADEIGRHPARGRLTPEETAKIKNLEAVYPRLYGLMVNYYYQKDEPVFTALIKDGGPEALKRFRSMYLDLAAWSGATFVRTVLTPSVHGPIFRPINARFRGKDTVEVVVMSTGNMAKLELPPPPDKPATLSPEFEKQWGLDGARFRDAFKITRGKGVRVAVLDSGIDMTHPIFRSTQFGKHFNFVGRDAFPWDPVGPPMVDYGWHGTVVSSIVAAYAPEAQITLYRYLDADSMNDAPNPLLACNQMAAAIYRAVHDGNDVINISAGTNLDSDYLRDACQYAYDNNVVLVTGSQYYMGRYLGQNEDYPGQYPVNISVTGIAKLGENKYGYWDAASPDDTTAVGAPCDPFVAYPYYSGEKDEYAPGISCATPIVASEVALVIASYPKLGTEAPGEYAAAVKKIVNETANSRIVGFDGFSPDCGHGLIDAEKAVRKALEMRAERGAAAQAAENAVAAAPAAGDEVFARGRAVFYKELSVALGLRPERDLLLLSERERIEGGADGTPGLYESVVNILFWEKGTALLALRGKDPAAFQAEYDALCRRAAASFVESLFTESPDVLARLKSSGKLGRGRLNAVLETLGLNAPPPQAKGLLKEAAVGSSRALGVCRFPQAWGVSKGSGIKLAVIDSGCAFESESLKKARLNHALDFSMIGRTAAPWEQDTVAPADGVGRGTLLASIAAACAPEAEIRIYKIHVDPESPFEYWPAMELARAIDKAVQDGADIVLTGAAFSRDFPFLKEACQRAYYANTIIAVPAAAARPGSADETPAYPAGYNMVLAAAGTILNGAGRPVPWPSSVPSKRTLVAAPADFVPGTPVSNVSAAGAAAGLAALLSARVPRTGKEYPGQQVQRVYEILKQSSDPKTLGFETFHARVGYGLINAERAVGPSAEAFIKKMKETDERFDKNMARRTKEIEDAARKEAEEKKNKK